MTSLPTTTTLDREAEPKKEDTQPCESSVESKGEIEKANYEEFINESASQYKEIKVESIQSFPKYYKLMRINSSSNRRQQLLVCKYAGCRAQFKKISNLMYHLHVHDNTRPFKCHMCNKRFVLRGNLRRHQEQAKNGVCQSSKPIGRRPLPLMGSNDEMAPKSSESCHK